LLRKVIILLLLALSVGVAWAQENAVIKTVTIRGRKNVAEQAILLAMKSKVGQPASRDTLGADEKAILDLGYFKDVKITLGVSDASGTEIVVDVLENAVVKEIRIIGNSVIPTDKLTETIKGIQPLNQILNLRKVALIADAVSKLYEAKGYMAQLEDVSPQEDSPNTLVVTILEPRVGEIQLTGLKRTKPSVIRRIMKTKPGEAFSVMQWRKDLEELFYSYWFEDMKPNESPSDKPGYRNLSIDFKEARTAQVAAGVALDPQSRLVGTANYSDSNFMGLGQNLGVFLSQATVGGGISAEVAYGNRFFDNKDTAMQLRLYSKVVYNFTGSGLGPFDSPDATNRFDERRTGASLMFSRPFGSRYRASLGLNAQKMETIDLTTDGSISYIQQDGDLEWLTLGADYDTRHPSGEPYRGHLVRFLLEPGISNITKIGGGVEGDTSLLGKSNFVRSTLELRKYWSKSLGKNAKIDDPRPVLAFRAKFGMISGTVPFFEQLFVGGADSLRGYQNQRFWGNRMILSTLEYRYPIQKSFNLVGFVDYGGAWGGYGNLRDFTQSDSMNLKLGYGVGLAFRTPLGPIRIDFGFNQDGERRTHFTLGTSF
jgi:outer membrane protein insertion porin family